MKDKNDLEVKCIVNSINKQVRIESTTPDYKSNAKNKVRLIEQKKALKK
jgi:hypothetical protein